MRSRRRAPGRRLRCRSPCLRAGSSQAHSSPGSSFVGHRADDRAGLRPVNEDPGTGSPYGSMSAVPTVVRWWGNHSDPERLELYTRWSFYGAMGLTPLLAMLGLGSTAAAPAPVLLGLVVAGAGAVTVLGVLLVR